MDTETEDYEDIDSEDEIQEPIQKQSIKISKPIQKSKKEVEEDKSPESRYVAYRVQAQEGIMDTETDKPVGNEIHVILAEILNKLNNIEISQA